MQTSVLIEKIYARPMVRVGLHFVFWAILFAVKLYLTYVSFNIYKSFPAPAFITITLSSTVGMALFYYFAVYGIMPMITVQKRYAVGIVLLLVGLCCYTLLDSYMEMKIISSCKSCIGSLGQENAAYAAYLHKGLINVVFTRLLGLGTPIFLLFALCIPFSIKMAIQAFRTNMRRAALAKENLQLEFNFLKAQLNPHFLFNAMNNIYGLIISGDKEKSANLVSRLSELLRYTLYDANEDKMPIDRELKLIGDYIALEKVRLNDTKVNFKFQLDHNDYHIAPLLLMPLVENAFKHSRDAQDSYIDIFLDLVQGRLRFTVENVITEKSAIKPAVGGIGISNLKKRLELYYPNCHWYESSVSDGVYSVHLTIQL